MGRRAYIAAPFEAESTSQPGKYYGVIANTAYVDFLEAIEDTLESSGWEPVLPHRESDWGRQYLKPADTVRRCLDLVRAADLIVAYPKHSRGVHLEMGYAAALGKAIVVLIDEGEQDSDGGRTWQRYSRPLCSFGGPARVGSKVELDSANPVQ